MDQRPTSGDVKIAAWQMPVGATAVDDALAALRVQVLRCEEAGVSVLCCPEAAIGGPSGHPPLGLRTRP
jgi:predicted amidohydrolase